MKRFAWILFAWILLIDFWVDSILGQDAPILIDFSGTNAEENNVTVMGAGFGQYPQADIAFGAIPTTNVFDNATDGRGMIIEADPGEGIMVFTPLIQTSNCALLRCTIRTSASHVSVYLATIDHGENVFVSTITPNNSALFVDQYERLADFFLPPSTGFQGLIQIVNTSQTEKMTAYLDNLEILILGENKIDLDVAEIIGKKSAPIATPTPINIPTATLAPSEVPTIPPTATSISDGITTGATIVIPIADLPSNAKPIEMVFIQAGDFTLGAPEDEPGRFPEEWTPHQVTLTKDFYMGKCEITQAQWQAVMGSNPSHYSNKLNNPVEQVSWYDSVIFCNSLSRLDGRTPVYNDDWTTNVNANGYRLPTEAEWEYACRAGSTTRFSFGNALDCSEGIYCAAADYSMWWLGNNTYNQNINGTKEVGKKIGNLFGLYDMHGNVREWCNDWWQDPYNRESQIDPQGPVSGLYKVIRGGYWGSYLRFCRSANREYVSPDYRYNDAGFRLIRTEITGISHPTPTPIISPTPMPPTSTSTITPNANQGDTITIPLDLPNGAIFLEMVLIKAGTFTMGSPEDERGRWSGEWSPHQVSLSKDFYMGKYEVTQAQWQAVMNENPSYFNGKPDYPVEQVTWEHCVHFCNELSRLTGRTLAYYHDSEWHTNWEANGFRLPTEAEWEYACRAGRTSRFSFDDALECKDSGMEFCSTADSEMWWLGNNTNNGNINGTKEVGKKLPNPWGLYDMHGNVWEWCNDWWQEPYFRGSQTDPKGPDSGSAKIFRGGCWGSFLMSCRSANRDYYGPKFGGNGDGLRLVRTP